MQTCPCCGHVAKENQLKEVEFLCVACGYADNADGVGTINIFRARTALVGLCKGRLWPGS